MKKVKFLTSIASHDFSYRPGDEADMEARIAEAWQRSGICAILPDAEPKETKKQGKNDTAKVGN